MAAWSSMFVRSYSVKISEGGGAKQARIASGRPCTLARNIGWSLPSLMLKAGTCRLCSPSCLRK